MNTVKITREAVPNSSIPSMMVGEQVEVVDPREFHGKGYVSEDGSVIMFRENAGEVHQFVLQRGSFEDVSVNQTEGVN